jgi:E3 ubiquitin-protein ligase SHPRH
LALILANRCPSADTGDNLLELKKPSSDTVDKNDSHHLSPAYLDTVTDNTFRCFCGRGKDKDSSSVWVWCQGCHEPMHFKCADFNSLEEAMASCILVTQDGFQKLTCNNNRCPLCHKMVVRSRATLIITPPAILAQWQREISRHVDDREFKNNVAIYRGVKAIVDGPKDCADRRYLHPAKLADHDIVLCTFDTLMTDLSHSHHNPFVQPLEGATTLPKKSLRWKKRYVVIPSPLIRIRWFRVVLDEAQRVEAPTVMSAKMALQLQAEHRWCVTGKYSFIIL